MHLRLLGTMILGALAACGGGGASTPPPAEPERASRCVADASLAATRRPKPPEVGCMGDTWDQLGEACNEKDDVDACYQIAVCVQLQALDPNLSAEDRDVHRRAILGGFDKACAGGIAEACELHVGARMMNQEPLPADACDYLRRGCGLGHEQGCFTCRYHECE